MKKILVLFLVLFLPLAAFAQEPLSQEVLDQAKLQAGLFLELKNALGLAWTDDYNAYLEDPVNSPQPAWAASVQDLINDSYLSETFPTDFAITPTGQEVTISRTITSQAIKDVLPIYLPSVAISGDTVSLLVQRPEQWVAWEAGLNSKISRDGGDDPDILPDASLEFGAGSKIEFVNNDGKLVGIDSLTYKGQELEDRFVNANGDNMSGDLYIKGNIAWHKGNDGSGSGLDADLLDGKDSSFFTNAGNLSSGIVPVARLSGTYDINISGNAATATKLATARTISLTGDASGSASFDGSSNISINTNVSYSSNSDKLDGYHASDFVKKAGDTMTGPLGVNFENGISSGIGSHSIRGTGPADVVGKGFKINWDTDFGFVGLVDKGADRKDMVFANEQTGDNFVFMSQGMEIMALKPASKTLEIGGNKVWHAGNDGSGSGLDADTLDGKHASELGGGSYNGIKVYSSPGTYTWTKNSGTKYVFVQVVGGGGGGEGIYTPGGNGGTSRFGSYCYATGGAGGDRYPYTAGSGFGGDINVTGLVSQQVVSYWIDGSYYYSEIPGTSPFGGTIGRGGASVGQHETGGAGGGYAAKWIDVSKVSSVSITVGAGGSAGSSGNSWRQASPGTPGIVIVHEFK